MIPLYSEEEFKRAKYFDKLPLQCTNCGETFYLIKKRVIWALKDSKKSNFCSVKCLRIYRNPIIDVVCHTCGKTFKKKKLKATKKSKNFCSQACANVYTSNVNKEDRLIKISIGLNQHFSKIPKKRKKCRICGQEICERKEVCKKFQNFPKLSKYFGFDMSKVGTKEVYSEYDKTINLLQEDYYKNNMSSIAIAEKYGYKYKNDLNTFLGKLFKIRGLSSASLVALETQRQKINTAPTKYRQGYHTSWNGKTFYYRSSYELEFANQLDETKVDYDVESLRIRYFDSQKKRERLSIPDFYIKDTNTIVEIKSTYTYDEQNMKDRCKAYKDHGYNFKLFLQKKYADVSSW
jgi:hypothetical protein